MFGSMAYMPNCVSGSVDGNAAAIQLPNVPCRGVYLLAASDTVVVGGPGVTLTTGIPVGTTTPFYCPVTNLNALYLICADANDDLIYVAFR